MEGGEVHGVLVFRFGGGVFFWQGGKAGLKLGQSIPFNSLSSSSSSSSLSSSVSKGEKGEGR